MSATFRGTRLSLSIAMVCLLAVPVLAQTAGQATPCGTAIGRIPATNGLVLTVSGLIYDANQGLGQGEGVCWLFNANLAGDPVARRWISPYLSATNPPTDPDPQGNVIITTPAINPDGTMDYQTALNWVNALNAFNDGKGWLNHNNWQLPTTTPIDRDCSSQNNGNFGVLCTKSALANLYGVGLARTYPDSVTGELVNFVWPFVNLQPGLYWTRSPEATAGYSTFSFNTGDTGSNTTRFNFFHVLPATRDALGPVPAGPGIVRPYTSGPGAGLAVYDSNTGLSWTLNANLAATEHFGFNDTTVLDTDSSDSDVNHTSFPMTVPMIDKDGAMHFDAVCAPTDDDPCAPPASGWIVSMNAHAFAGSSNWKLPRVDELATLYADIGLGAGDTRLEWPWFTGPFWRLQPGFYWSCERDSNSSGNGAPCDPGIHPGWAPGSNDTIQMNYSFNFGDGFLGTDKFDKHFYVIVYFPIRPPSD